MTVARLVRGQMLSLKETEFVEAAKAIGVSDRKIVTQAPAAQRRWARSSSPITLGIPAAILAEATLAYIGIGVQPPRASWGSLIAEGQKFIRSDAAPRALPGHLHRARPDQLHVPRRRPARRARPEAQGKAVGGDAPTTTCPPPNAPTIIELSADDVLRARTSRRCRRPASDRKADAPARGPRPVDPLLHARRRRPGGRRRELRRRLRRDARPGRRVRLRQERHRAVDRPARAGPARQDRRRLDPVRRDRPPQAQRRRHAQAARQGDRVHLPGPADQPQPDADHRLPDRRGDPRAHGPVGRRRPRDRDRRAAGEGRHPARQATA